jgi:hypothetical protein
MVVCDGPDGLRLEKFARRTAPYGLGSESYDPSDVLRARRFETIKEIESALRDEIHTRDVKAADRSTPREGGIKFAGER